MCTYLLDSEEELDLILYGVTYETLDNATTNTESGSMTDSAVRFPTSEGKVPAPLDDIAEGEYRVLQVVWTYTRTQHPFILM